MRTIKQIACVIGVVIGISLHAQSIVPGYQGKKTFVDYKVNVTPAFRHPTYLNRIMPKNRDVYPRGTAEESAFIPFNVTHTISIERVMGRKFSMSFNYMFAASKEYFTFNHNVINSATGVTTTYSYTNEKMNVYGHYYTGSFVIYGKNALAPYGKYFKLTAGYCSMMGKFVEKQLESDNEASVLNPLVLNSDVGYYKTGSFGWGCSFGTNRIYNDRIVVNRGIGFFLPTRSDDIKDVNLSLKNVSWTISNRLHLRDLATFYLGVGYLF
ncbi:MAG: hypothetical protein K0S33_4030 [Bacteroidetes bacterium]|jgi:hypothetical protein|nr:hypothetical protein [Bacteroidota bacterium]